jgi:flagellar hook-associated protein 3 FlgL
MLRVTTQQQYNTSIDNMQKSNVKLDHLQQQISTGKRILQPSDDPVAAAQVLKLERELAKYDKYEININATETRLTLQESVMQSMRTSMDRVKELVVQGSTGTLTDSDRASIAVSLKIEADFMADLMNTQDVQGEYIFSGSQGNIQPYQKQPDGSYVYQGDDGQRKIQVSDNLFVPAGDAGQYLFEAVTNTLQTTVKGVYATQAGPPAAQVTNVVFDSVEDENQFKDFSKGLGDLTITTSVVLLPAPAVHSYSVIDSKGAAVLSSTGTPLTGITYTPGDRQELHGMRFDLAASVSPESFVGENTNVLHTEPERKNILDAVQSYAKELEKPVRNGDDRNSLEKQTERMFGQWDQASERNIESTTQLGTRLSFMEDVKSNNLDFELFAKTSLSSIQDVNMPEAISKFKLEEVTLQASQQIFGRLSALSLFNHLQ